MFLGFLFFGRIGTKLKSGTLSSKGVCVVFCLEGRIDGINHLTYVLRSYSVQCHMWVETKYSLVAADEGLPGQLHQQALIAALVQWVNKHISSTATTISV